MGGGFRRCCVPFCGSCKPDSPRLILHTLPKCEKTRNLWLKNLRLSTETNPRSSVCSAHFQPGDYTKGNKLKDTAIPTLTVVHNPVDVTAVNKENGTGTIKSHRPSILKSRKKKEPCNILLNSLEVNGIEQPLLPAPQAPDMLITDPMAPEEETRPELPQPSDTNIGQVDDNGSSEPDEISDSSELDESNLPAECSDCVLLDLQDLSVGGIIDDHNEEVPMNGDGIHDDANNETVDDPENVNEPVMGDEPDRQEPRRRLTILSMIRSDEEMVAFTGVNLSIFEGLVEAVNLCESKADDYSRIKKFVIDSRNRIALCLIKLKLNLSFRCLSVLFGISRNVCASHFYYMVRLLAKILKNAIYWPTKEECQHSMPRCFKGFEKTRVVLDCTEIPVERPRCLKCRLRLYSFYKSCETLKVLIGVSASGLLSFLSKVYGGRASDKAIFIQSGILEKLEPTRDAVMVDKGFAIETECLENHIQLIIPPKLGKNKQMPKTEVDRTNKIAAARVHVERTIQRFKLWDIVSSKVQWILIPYIDDIFTIIGGLVNYQNPILADDKYEQVV